MALTGRFEGNGRPRARGTLVDLVTRELREAIVQGRLEPGERIRQEAVARQYGTSRIPVREALRELQSEGLVTLAPNVGARVASLDLAELVELYLIRERLEPLAIARAAVLISDELLNELRELEGAMEDIAPKGSKKRWLELDARFHVEIYGAARMPRLMPFILRCWNSTQQYRRAYVGQADRYDLAHADHRLLIEALGRRDAEGAETILRMHIRRVRLTLAEQAEIFDR